MSWLYDTVCDSKTGKPSVKHVTILMASSTLSLSTLTLTVMVFWRPEVVAVLMAFGPTLGGMAGVGYVMGKPAERKQETST